MRVNFSGTIAGTVVVRAGETRQDAVNRAQENVAEALTARAKRYGPVNDAGDILTGPTVASFTLGSDVIYTDDAVSDDRTVQELAGEKAKGKRRGKAAE